MNSENEPDQADKSLETKKPRYNRSRLVMKLAAVCGLELVAAERIAERLSNQQLAGEIEFQETLTKAFDKLNTHDN